MSPRWAASARLQPFGAYAFDELDKLCTQRRAEGVDVIDFGVGDPTDPVPAAVVAACADGLERHRRSGYPSYAGSARFREAAATFLQRRFGVNVDPARQVTATSGSKEAVFHLPLAFVNPGQVVLLPAPGYPPYVAGTAFADGRPVTYSVGAEGPLLPDLDALPEELRSALAVVWITQPHVPTGRFASLAELERLAQQCRRLGVLLCSDEAYSELGFEQAPPSALQTGSEGVLVFQSLSKQAAMTGYRIGFVAGDPQASAIFRRLKTQIDSGAPDFVQDAAVAALLDPSHAAVSRAHYVERAQILLPALRAVGCQVQAPQAGLYLWARVPGGSGLEFSRQLLAESPSLVVLPGEWLVDERLPRYPAGGVNPGAGRVRVALVPDRERCRQAAQRLLAWHATCASEHSP